MASTYTSKLRLTLPATGDLNGLWGGTVNSEITSLIEQALAGRAAIAMTDADYTPTALNGTSDEARNMVLRFTGTLTANRNIIVPTQAKLYIVENATTGGFALTVKTAAGSGVSVPSATASLVRCDATNVVGGFNVNVATAQGVLPVANGGTGTSTGAGLALTGEVKMWPTAVAPTGHLLCDGAAVSRTTYAALFAALGSGASVWGLGDGSTTFNVPDFRDRMPIGAGTTYAANASGGSKDAVVVSHTHTATSTDSGHVHPSSATNTPIAQVLAAGVTGAAANGSQTGTGNANITTTVNSTGVSGTNANLPPYRGIYFIIKT